MIWLTTVETSVNARDHWSLVQKQTQEGLVCWGGEGRVGNRRRGATSNPPTSGFAWAIGQREEEVKMWNNFWPIWGPDSSPTSCPGWDSDLSIFRNLPPSAAVLRHHGWECGPWRQIDLCYSVWSRDQQWGKSWEHVRNAASWGPSQTCWTKASI